MSATRASSSPRTCRHEAARGAPVAPPPTRCGTRPASGFAICRSRRNASRRRSGYEIDSPGSPLYESTGRVSISGGPNRNKRLPVIARSPCDEAIQGPRHVGRPPSRRFVVWLSLDCFALLAMTGATRFIQGGRPKAGAELTEDFSRPVPSPKYVRHLPRVPDLVGSRLPSPYHFRARNQSFQAVAAQFPSGSVLSSASRAAIPPTKRLGSNHDRVRRPPTRIPARPGRT